MISQGMKQTAPQSKPHDNRRQVRIMLRVDFTPRIWALTLSASSAVLQTRFGSMFNVLHFTRKLRVAPSKDPGSSSLLANFDGFPRRRSLSSISESSCLVVFRPNRACRSAPFCSSRKQDGVASFTSTYQIKVGAHF